MRTDRRMYRRPPSYALFLSTHLSSASFLQWFHGVLPAGVAQSV